MTVKGSSARRTEIPVGYVEADPAGNRASRRMATKEAKAARRGRVTGHSSGGDPVKPPRELEG